MTVVRRIARPMLAAMFVQGGLDSLRNPAPMAPAAARIGGDLAARVPYLPKDPEALVRLNGGVMVVAGTLLGLGRVPRLAALALAATLVPTTLAGHRFWEERDPQQRANQRIQFTKNVSMLGGLLIAAVDTEGRPGVAWRTRRAARDAQRAARVARRAARREAKLARVQAASHLPGR